MPRQRYRDRTHRDHVDRRPWFVLVALPPALRDQVMPVIWAVGPVGSWSRARELSDAWERVHGPNTAPIRERIPHRYQVVKTVSAAGR